MAALKHNTFFTVLCINNSSRKDLLLSLAKALCANRSLKVLRLQNLTYADATHELGMAIQANPNNKVKNK